MSASFVESYNGYWVCAADRKPRNFSWQNTMIADSQAAIFLAQTLGVGRGRVEVKLTFEGLVKDARGEGIWIYDRDRWFWRISFKDAAGKDYVFITLKEPRGPLPLASFRTSVFGAVYQGSTVVGHVRWRITMKEVSRLYKTIRPFESELLNRVYRMALMYPTILGAGSAYSALTWASGLVRSVATYGLSFYAGEVSSDVADSDYMMPYPFEADLSNDDDIAIIQSPASCPSEPQGRREIPAALERGAVR